MVEQYDANPFKLGVVLSSLNLAAFPFWTIYTALLVQKGWFSLVSPLSMLVYVTGIAFGTLASLRVFVWLSAGCYQPPIITESTSLRACCWLACWLFRV